MRLSFYQCRFSFPESDPDIKQSQAAAQAAHKTVGDECAKSGRAEQKMVVGPLRPPGQDDQKNPYRGAEKNEQQYQDPVQPELKAGLRQGLGHFVDGRIRTCSHVALPSGMHATGRRSPEPASEH